MQGAAKDPGAPTRVRFHYGRHRVALILSNPLTPEDLQPIVRSLFALSEPVVGVFEPARQIFFPFSLLSKCPAAFTAEYYLVLERSGLAVPDAVADPFASDKAQSAGPARGSQVPVQSMGPSVAVHAHDACLSMLPAVLVQSLMHALLPREILSLARCSKWTLQCANSAFAWRDCPPLRLGLDETLIVPLESARFVRWMPITFTPVTRWLSEDDADLLLRLLD